MCCFLCCCCFCFFCFAAFTLIIVFARVIVVAVVAALVVILIAVAVAVATLQIATAAESSIAIAPHLFLLLLLLLLCLCTSTDRRETCFVSFTWNLSTWIVTKWAAVVAVMAALFKTELRHVALSVLLDLVSQLHHSSGFVRAALQVLALYPIVPHLFLGFGPTLLLLLPLFLVLLLPLFLFLVSLLVTAKVFVDLTHPGEFVVFVKCLHVEMFAVGELDLRNKRSIDVDAADVGLVVSGFRSVVFLERRFRISKVDSGILLKTCDLFLARQVFALYVGPHFAQEFLLVVGVLEFQHFHVCILVVCIGCLSVGVSKFVHPKLTSLSGEDRDGGCGCGGCGGCGGGGGGLRCSGWRESLVRVSDVR